MTSRQMKSCSTSLNIKKMQIKIKMKYYLTPIRIAIIKMSTNNKCCRGCVEKGTLPHCWWEYKLAQPLWRMVWRFLKKLKIKLPYNPAIPVLGIYSDKTIIQKYTCMATFLCCVLLWIAALFTIAKSWKQSKCLLADEWIKEKRYIYIIECHSATEKSEIMWLAATDAINILSEVLRRRKWQPSPVFLPGESRGQRSLAGCYTWGCTGSDMTEVT